MAKITPRIDSLYDDLADGTRELEKTLKTQSPRTPNTDTDESKFTAIPIDCLPINLPLSCPLYVKMKDKFIMFRRQGDKISSQRLVALQGKDVSTLYIHNAFWNFFLKTLEDLKLPDNSTPEKRVQHIRSLLVVYGEELQKIIKTPKKEIFQKLEKQSHELAIAVHDNLKSALKSLKRSSDPASYFINHSINTAIFSALIAKTVGHPLNIIKEITFAAVVHNVGNAFIPRKILYKTSGLNPEEWALVHAHPNKGAELLQTVGCAQIAVTIAHQHHERINGTGYPRRLVDKQIHPLAKIVSIADVYDAIRSNRPHQSGQPVETAIKRITRQKDLFDPKFLKTIFEKLS